jgi:hypothetical protein
MTIDFTVIRHRPKTGVKRSVNIFVSCETATPTVFDALNFASKHTALKDDGDWVQDGDRFEMRWRENDEEKAQLFRALTDGVATTLEPCE